MTVTLAGLDDVRARRKALAGQLADGQQRSQTLRAEMEAQLADAGAILVPRYREWANPDAKGVVDQAHDLMRRIDADDTGYGNLEQQKHPGLGGFFARQKDKRDEKKLTKERQNLAEELRKLLVQIGAYPTSIAEAEALRGSASGLVAERERLEVGVAEVSSEMAALDQEISARRDSEKSNGFDALYTAAYLGTYGPPDVASPLLEKTGETAMLVEPATLMRRQTKTRFVGGSHGMSFPIGHTGIRYRVGSFQGHPIHESYLASLDSGSLVVTNRRLAYVGQLKSSAFALEKLLHVEVYTDALAVFKEGRENPDIFKLGRPKLVWFYINYALQAP